jgi:predicted DNA-binding transcriptional regulator YafY
MSVAPSWELKSWIKGFVPHVRVLQPAALREEVARELSAGLSAAGPARGKSGV